RVFHVTGVQTCALPICMALIEGARRQVVAHRHPVIKDETLTLPFALLCRHLLEVLEDAALEVIDLLETFLEHEAGGLLAADTTEIGRASRREGEYMEGE